ncbi:MAG: hypothetical protein EP297_10515 [Gammaproteobacteria bacterium]|nr:MAG: hypothetical protein EP297_10515 [Gammaproteobacteria bacterium]
MKKLLMTALTIAAMFAGVAQAGNAPDWNFATSDEVIVLATGVAQAGDAPNWSFATSDEVIETVSVRFGLNQDVAEDLRIEQGTPCWPQVYSQVD